MHSSHKNDYEQLRRESPKSNAPKLHQDPEYVYETANPSNFIEYNYSQEIPSHKETKVGGPPTNDSKKDSIKGFLVAMLIYVISIVLMGHLLLVFFGLLPRAITEFECDGEYEVACYFLNANRILVTVIFAPILLYIISAASHSAIPFLNTKEVEKWGVFADIMGLHSTIGMLYAIIFLLITSFSTFLYFDDIKIPAAFDFPDIYTSSGFFIVVVVVYLSISTLSICDKEQTCCQTNIFSMDFTAYDNVIWSINENPANLKSVNKDNIIKYSQLLIAIIYFVMMPLLILPVIHGWEHSNDIMKSSIGLFFIILSVSKYALFAINMFAYEEKVHKYLIVKFIMIYVESTLIFDLFELDGNIHYGLISYTSILTALFILTFIHTWVTNQYQDIGKEVRKFIHEFLVEEEMSKFLSMSIVLGTLIPFFELLSTAETSGFDISKVPHEIVWAKGITDATKDSLVMLNPTISMLRYGDIIMSILNFEQKTFFVVIVLIILFGYRMEGDGKEFAFIWNIIIIYQGFCILRMDGIIDSITEFGSIGYAEMPTGSAVEAIRDNYIYIFTSIWITVSLHLTRHKLENDKTIKYESVEEKASISDDKEIRHSKPKHIGKCPFKCKLKNIMKTLLTVILSVFIGLFICHSFTNEWMTVQPKNYTSAKGEDSAAYIKDMAILNEETADQTIVGSDLKDFLENLKKMGEKLDRKQTKEEVLFEQIKSSPLSDSSDKFGFVLPGIIVVIYTMFGECLDISKQRKLIITAILMFTTMVNFMILIATYFLIFIQAEALPYFSIEVNTHEGFYMVMMASIFSLIVLSMRFIDLVSPLNLPQSPN